MSAEPLTREEREKLIRLSPGGFDYSMTHRWEATVQAAVRAFYGETVEAERRAEAAEERAERLREALMVYADLIGVDEPWTVPLWRPAHDALRADDAARGAS